ncbi:MAG: 2-oxo acid dehydrogenase subunit E2, partial [Actinomycetota bacterium]|nr:2-oxo acid dehydrogenase subunit E2 [Actinomycetota bacterium]
MPDFKLPDLGEGVTEAEVDRWLVKEGDVIAEDDPLVELITDKATAEVPSPYAGTVTKIHVEAGQVVPVGTVLVTIGDDGAGRPDEQTTGTEAGAEMRSSKATPPPPPKGDGNNGIKAMPPVRKLAEELGVDLAAVTGTGAGGAVTRADVLGYAARSKRRDIKTQPADQPPEETPLPSQEPDSGTDTGRASTAVPSGGRREPLRGVRRTIAQRMTDAHRTIPAVTHVEECDVSELDATRKLANERAPDQPRLTFLPFIVKAVVQGLKDHPSLNASLDEDAGEIVFHDRYDIGVAVDTDQGLIVPVVKAADSKRLREIAAEIDDLAQRARAGTLDADSLRGGTFTVTSPGAYGGLMATPIILAPQSAILGVHRAEDRPVVRDGQIVIRKMMNMSITFDHRILDGMDASRFLL